MTEDEKLVAELLDMTQVFDPQRRRVTASAISRLTAEVRELRAEIEAAKLFGGGFFGDKVEEIMREYYREKARAALKPDPSP